MTIENETRLVRHIGNDSATEFAFDFLIPTNADLVVTLYDTEIEETTVLTRDVDFSVTGIGDDDGGEVTYPLSGDPLTSTEWLIIKREVAYEQTLEINDQGGYLPSVLMAQLDRIVMMAQQLKEEVNRSLKIVPGGDVTDVTMAEAEEGKALKWNANGNLVNSTYDPDEAAEVAQTAAAVAQAVSQSGLVWEFSSSTTDADPGAGVIRFNNATLASVTKLYFDNVNYYAATMTAFLDGLDDAGQSTRRGTLYLFKAGAPANFLLLRVTGTVTDGTGYRKVDGTVIASGGSFTAGDLIAVQFAAAGADGTGSGDFSGPASSVGDNLVSFNGTGGKTGKDSGIAASDVLLSTDLGSTVQGYDADTCKNDVEDQIISGGGYYSAAKDLGNTSGTTQTPDPGDRAVQKVSNNGAWTLAPHATHYGAYRLIVLNASGAAVPTTNGWTSVDGAFDTTVTSKFLCSCEVWPDFSYLNIKKIA